MADCHNTCCICLESLFSADTVLGVVRPCGHPIHETCFRSWEASRLAKGFDRHTVSCPTCKAGGAKFLRIYLTMPTVADIESDDDDDDSSVEYETAKGDVDGDDNSNENEGENEQETANKDDDDDDDDVVLDLTASPTKKKCKKDAADTDTKTLKLRVRKYKLQHKQIESKFQDVSKKQQEMLERHQSMKKELEETKQEALAAHKDYNNNLLELSQKRLEMKQLQRDLEGAKAAREFADNHLKKMTDAFERERSHHAEKLHQAKHCRSVETKKIMEDYPKVMEELKLAKKKLEEKDKWIATVRVKMKQMEPKYRDELAKVADEAECNNPRKQRKRRLEMMKELNDNRNAQDAQMKQRDEQRKSEVTTKKMATPRAMQMVNAAAAQAKKDKARSNRIDNVLGIWESSNRDNVQQSSSLPKAVSRGGAAGGGGAFHLSTKTKRKPVANRNMAGFGKKNSLNGGGGGKSKMDIRTMFGPSK